MLSSLRRQNEDLRIKVRDDSNQTCSGYKSKFYSCLCFQVAKLEKEKTRERRESAVKLAREADKRSQDETRHLRATVKELERLLETEREERKVTETKSLELLTEVRKKWEAREEARVDKIEKEFKKSESRRVTLEQELKKALETTESQRAELKAVLEVKASLKAKLKECKSKLEMTFGRFEEEAQKVRDLKEHSFLLAEAANKTTELEKSALARDLSDERDSVTSLRRELESTRKELERAKSVDRDQKETLQFLRAEKEVTESEHERQVAKLTKERDGFLEDKEQLKIKVSLLEGECDSASIKMKDKDQKLEELGKVLEKLESKIKPADRLPKGGCDCKKELKKTQDELSMQKVEVRLLERKNKELEERIKWRVEMSRDEREERQKLEKEAKDAKDRAKGAEEAAKKGKEEAEKAAKKIPALESETESLKKTVASLKVKEEEGKDAARRLERVEKQLEQAKAEAKNTSCLSEMNAKLKVTCLELQDQCTDYESVLEKLESALKSEKSARQRFEGDSTEQAKAASELRIERNELKSRLIFAETQAKEARAKHEDVEAAFHREEEEWSQRLSKVAGTREEQEAALRKMRDQMDYLARESARTGEEATALREQNLQLKEESSELITSTRSLKESNLRLNAVVEESLRKIERRNGELVRARDELAAIRDDKERRDNENAVHIEQLKKLIEHLRGKNDALEMQLAGKKSGKKRPAETGQLPAPGDVLLRTPGRGGGGGGGGGAVSRSRSPAKTPRGASRSPLKSPPRKAFK